MTPGGQGRGKRGRWSSPVLTVGMVICGALLLVAVAAPWLVPRDPAAMSTLGLAPPGSGHPLGTDVLGRDVLSRLILGSRISLVIGWMSVLVALVLGVGVGLAAGLGARGMDRALMLITDAFMAFPRIFLVLLLISLSAPSAGLIILVLGLTGWMPVARLVRAEALGLRERDFVAAARGLGLSPWRIAWRHVLPNLMPTVIVAAALRVGGAILAESFLSFLGLGVQDPVVSWGQMIQQGRNHLREGWWLVTFPGLAITLTVVGYNLLGDGLRERLDPRRGKGARV